MKRKISLRLYISILFLSLTALLVIGYSILSLQYYRLGMDAVTAADMVRGAEHFLSQLQKQRIKFPVSFHGLFIARQWSDMPDEIRDQLPEGPIAPGKLVVADNATWWHKPDVVTFALLYVHDEKPLYIVRVHSHLSPSPHVGRTFGDNLRHLFLLTLVAGILVAIVTKLILYRVSKPVSALGYWAKSLDAATLEQVPPDFTYPELNDLAALIRTSLSSVQEGLEREHRFLKHASHELRTPISVIRNNIELMHKLHKQPKPNILEKEQQIIDRIDRASLNMKHMTEILLWLSREKKSPLSTHPVRLDSLVSELTEDLNYLVTGKEVNICLETSPYTIQLSETVARIVLGNLIRNAMQHTQAGKISIRQQENQIVIHNSQAWTDDYRGNDLGFGLGIHLTRQLTAKLGWPYETSADSSGNTVTVVLLDA